jgi:hypothetical protein
MRISARTTRVYSSLGGILGNDSLLSTHSLRKLEKRKDVKGKREKWNLCVVLLSNTKNL